MNKMLMILVPVLVIGGVVGAGMTGMVDIPGLTPKKAKPKASADKAADETKTADETATPDAAPPQEPDPEPAKVASTPPAPKDDPILGQKKIATLWSEIDTPKLMKIVADWKNPELAEILRRMDPSKTAELLAAMDEKRASALSREIQKQSSALPPPTS